MIRLSDLVHGDGYGFLVTPTPHLVPGVLGDPEDPHGFDALVARDPGECTFIACRGDVWDWVYACSHEIAEHQSGFGHTVRTFELQARILSGWVRRLAEQHGG